MEVITANGSTSICNTSSYKYPNILTGASGGFLGNKMIICGGDYLSYDDPSNITCYSFGDENEWQEHSSRKDNVAHGSAAIPLLNGLWITGGVVGSPRQHLDSTEIVLLNGTRVEGIKLPLPLEYHCAVKHNDIAILLGGI